MKRLALLLSLALFTVACSSAATATAPTDTVQESGVTQSAPAASSSSTASTPPEETPGTLADTGTGEEKAPPEGPVAPDFTTVLASGESYTLSEAVKPVYMVFWAEW